MPHNLSYFVARNEYFRTIAPYEMAIIIENGYYHSFFLYLSEEKTLNKREEEFLLLASSFSAKEQTDSHHLQLNLGNEWQENEMDQVEENEKSYSHQNGALLYQTVYTTENFVGDEMYKEYYNTDSWSMVLEGCMTAILKGFGLTGDDTYVVSMNNDVNCYAANAELQETPVVFAVFQYDNDFWIMICSGGEKRTAASMFEDICAAIQLI